MEEQNKSFLGRGWSFPPKFDHKTGKLKMAFGEKDIEQSIMILLSTYPGERIGKPEYGCPLQDYVYASNDLTGQFMMREAIRRAVLRFEPRVDFEDVVFDESKLHEGVLGIDVIYTVRSTNTRTNITYPYYLIEGTDITEI